MKVKLFSSLFPDVIFTMGLGNARSGQRPRGAGGLLREAVADEGGPVMGVGEGGGGLA